MWRTGFIKNAEEYVQLIDYWLLRFSKWGKNANERKLPKVQVILSIHSMLLSPISLNTIISLSSCTLILMILTLIECQKFLLGTYILHFKIHFKYFIITLSFSLNIKIFHAYLRSYIKTALFLGNLLDIFLVSTARYWEYRRKIQTKFLSSWRLFCSAR